MLHTFAVVINNVDRFDCLQPHQKNAKKRIFNNGLVMSNLFP